MDVLANPSYSPVIYASLVRKSLSLATYRAVAVFVDQTDPVDDFIYQTDVRDPDAPRPFDLEGMTDRAAAVDRACSSMLDRLTGSASPRRLALFNLLEQRWRPLALAAAFPPGHEHHRYIHLSLVARSGLIRELNNQPESEESRGMLALTASHLDRLVTSCRQHAVPLFLAANPWQFQSARRRPRRALWFDGPFPMANRLETLILADRYASVAGVHVVPLTGAFRDQPDPAGLFLDARGEVHWNAAGHAVVERSLRETLLREIPDLGR